MSGRLEGKKIVVTAAGQGIGKATAIAFHNCLLYTSPSPRDLVLSRMPSSA